MTFALPQAAARDGKDVRLVGDFNAWSWEQGYRMKPKGDELVVDVELATGRDYQFRFLVDNRIWENHWDADAYATTPFGVNNSVVSLSNVARSPRVVAPTAPAPSCEAVPTRRETRDDLTAIEGIGPKNARLLESAGITTFADLATTRPASLRDILAAGGSQFRRHDPSSWPKLALHATGKTAPESRLDLKASEQGRLRRAPIRRLDEVRRPSPAGTLLALHGCSSVAITL